MTKFICRYCEHAASTAYAAVEHERTCPGHQHVEIDPAYVPPMLLRRTIGYVACVGTDAQRAAAHACTDACLAGDTTKIGCKLSALRTSLKCTPELLEHFNILLHDQHRGTCPDDKDDVVRVDVSKVLDDHVGLLKKLMMRLGWKVWMHDVMSQCLYVYRASTFDETLGKVLAEFPDAKMVYWRAQCALEQEGVR